MKEQARDYFINRQFRKDYFIRGVRKLSQAERKNRLLNMKFVLITTAGIEMKCRTALGEITITNADFEKVRDYLISDNYRPKKISEILEHDPSITFANVEQIITVLNNNDKVMPCQDDEAINKVKINCDKLNDFICKRAETSSDIINLASPVIGGGITIGRFDQIFLSYYKRGITDIEEMSKAAWFAPQPDQSMVILPLTLLPSISIVSPACISMPSPTLLEVVCST